MPAIQSKIASAAPKDTTFAPAEQCSNEQKRPECVQRFLGNVKDHLQPGVLLISTTEGFVALTETPGSSQLEFMIIDNIILICVHIKYMSARRNAELLIAEIEDLNAKLRALSFKLCIVGDFNHLQLDNISTLDKCIGIYAPDCNLGVCRSTFSNLKIANVLAPKPSFEPITLFNTKVLDEVCVAWLVSVIRNYFNVIADGQLPTDHKQVSAQIDGIDIMVVGLAGIANGRFAVWPLLMDALYGLFREYKNALLQQEQEQEQQRIDDSDFKKIKEKITSLARLAAKQSANPSINKPWMFNVSDHSKSSNKLKELVGIPQE